MPVLMSNLFRFHTENFLIERDICQNCPVFNIEDMGVYNQIVSTSHL